MDEDFEACKEEFINNLKRVISEDLPEEGGVTNDSLEELVELARDKDLSKIKSVKDLYRCYCRITGKRFEDYVF